MTNISDIRVNIGDDAVSQRYTDAQIISVIQKAARSINRELSLKNTSEEIIIDGTGEFTQPDDDDLVDLVLMQAECMLMTRDFSEALNEGSEGIRVKDGEQEVDSRKAGETRGVFYNSPYNPCALLRDALKFEKIRRSGGGKVVY